MNCVVLEDDMSILVAIDCAQRTSLIFRQAEITSYKNYCGRFNKGLSLKIMTWTKIIKIWKLQRVGERQHYIAIKPSKENIHHSNIQQLRLLEVYLYRRNYYACSLKCLWSAWSKRQFLHNFVSQHRTEWISYDNKEEELMTKHYHVSVVTVECMSLTPLVFCKHLWPLATYYLKITTKYGWYCLHKPHLYECRRLCHSMKIHPSIHIYTTVTAYSSRIIYQPYR